MGVLQIDHLQSMKSPDALTIVIIIGIPLLWNYLDLAILVLMLSVYRIAPRSCVHITIMAEARNMRGLLTLRDMISDIYFYSANSTAPLFFSFKFSQDLNENDYRMRIVFSEQPSVEGMERNKLFAAPYATDLSKSPKLRDLVPSFFTHFPERNYYMMPLGPEYDPDMDETDEAYAALRILLKDGRSNIY